MKTFTVNAPYHVVWEDHSSFRDSRWTTKEDLLKLATPDLIHTLGFCVEDTRYYVVMTDTRPDITPDGGYEWGGTLNKILKCCIKCYLPLTIMSTE